jgi:bifunctional UDP-N-acetylglucosamine pyrophosphorylase/glucosamine-1-phosphate N-acetyltransferase
MSAESSDCLPLTLTRRLADFPIANVPLSEHQRRVIGAAGLGAHPHAWLAPGDLSDFLTSGASALVDAAGTALAWHGDAPDDGNVFAAKTSFLIRYAWDFLRANEQYVASLLENIIEGDIHSSAVIEGVIHLGSGTRILPGVFIEGNVVIGSNSKIGPNCYIRGNTSIGDGCHIGQSVEIKNCLILSKTNVGHLSYVGDSVLGEKVNFGAGTTTSNLRHDGKNHRSEINGGLIDTGRRKFGTIVGDRVHTGINTSIYPGRKLWPDTTTRPGEIVQRDVHSQI